MRTAVARAGLCVVLAGAAWAQPLLACKDGKTQTTPLPMAELGLATVAGTESVHFSNCAGPDCERRAYVYPGDTVITGNVRNGWVCVLFPDSRTSGWMPQTRLTPATIDRDPPLAAWTGKWTVPADQEIKITITEGKLLIAGEAYWQGAVINFAHTGELSGAALPDHDRLQLQVFEDAYACRADMRLVGPYLLVEDNGRCGGVNVSFTGVYHTTTR